MKKHRRFVQDKNQPDLIKANTNKGMKKNINQEERFAILLWLILLILGVLTFFEFYHINIKAYIAPQELWKSRRFITFLFISVVSFSCFIKGFIYYLKGKITFFQTQRKNLPDWLTYFINGLLVLLPFLI